MKLKLKGRRFDTIEEILAESQRVLDTVIEKDSISEVKNERSYSSTPTHLYVLHRNNVAFTE
jgi:hypothetical protein